MEWTPLPARLRPPDHRRDPLLTAMPAPTRKNRWPRIDHRQKLCLICWWTRGWGPGAGHGTCILPRIQGYFDIPCGSHLTDHRWLVD